MPQIERTSEEAIGLHTIGWGSSSFGSGAGGCVHERWEEGRVAAATEVWRTACSRWSVSILGLH